MLLGGVLENRREFLYLEAVRVTATGAGVLTLGGWFGGVHDTRTLLAIAAFAALSMAWLAAASPASAVASRAHCEGREF